MYSKQIYDGMTLITDLTIPLVLRSIPQTSPTKYISGWSALNLTMPNTSGDWHHADTIYTSKEKPAELTVFGDTAEEKNTNHIFGKFGIIESSQQLKEWGFLPEYLKVYRADHFRAILDLLFYELIVTISTKPYPFATQYATEDFLDTEDQKDIIMNKAELIRPYLPTEKHILLDSWLITEKKGGYRS